MDKSFYSIFKTFFKVGTLLLGGGYVILPLLTSELVDKKKWITSDELCEYNALAASIPGIIAVNTALFTGRKLLKTKGAIAAIAGIVLPAFISIILLATLFSQISANHIIQNIFWGVGIGIVVLLLQAIREMWPKSVNDKFTYILYFIVLLLTLSGKIPLYLIIIMSMIIGIIYQRAQKGNSKC